MVFLKIFAGFVVVVCVLFLLLGLKSQKGAAPGLINGELAEAGAAPNMVSSESETQPEKKVAPLKGSLADIRAAIVSTGCLLYTSPSPRDKRQSRMPSSA